MSSYREFDPDAEATRGDGDQEGVTVQFPANEVNSGDDEG